VGRGNTLANYGSMGVLPSLAFVLTIVDAGYASDEFFNWNVGL